MTVDTGGEAAAAHFCTRRGQAGRLGAALALSLLLHLAAGALLAAMARARPGAPPPVALRVALVPPAQLRPPAAAGVTSVPPAAQPVSPAAAQGEPAQSPPPALRPATRAATERARRPPRREPAPPPGAAAPSTAPPAALFAQPEPNPPVAPEHPPAGAADRAGTLYLEDLLSRIRDRRRYPAAAERAGIEGRVDTSFVLLADGTATDIRTSGAHPLLLRAAAQALAAPLLPPPAGVPAPLQVRFTLVFRLR